MKSTVLLLIAFLAFNSIEVGAQSSCDNLLTHGLRNVYEATSFESFTDSTYSKYCNESYSNHSKASQLEIDVIFKKIDLGIGSSSSSSKQKHRQFCKEYQRDTTFDSVNDVKAKNLHDTAINAWQACIEVSQSGFIFDPVIASDQKSVVVDMKYTGPGEGLAFNGVETTSMNCTYDGNTVDSSTKLTINNNVVAITCLRTSSMVSVGGSVSQYFPTANVVLKTASKSVPINFTEMLEAPAKTRFQSLEAEIAGIKQSLKTYQKSLENKPSTIKSSINSHKGQWGKWHGIKSCPTGQYVCGMRSRFEKAGQKDDTALNSVELQCCSF